MKSPGPLSSAARELLELGSRVDPPTPEQCERMDRTLLPLLSAGRAATGAGVARALTDRCTLGPELLLAQPGAARRPLQRELRRVIGSSTTQVMLALGALAATAAAFFWLGRVSSPPPGALDANRSPALALAPSTAAPLEAAPPDAIPPSAALPAAAMHSAAIPPAAMTAVPTAATLGAPASSEPAPPLVSTAGEAPRATRARSRAPSSADLAAEIDQLSRAEAALRQGHAGAALVQLERRPVRHLVEQAAALEAIAHCELEGEGGHERAQAVLLRFPASAFEARLRGACGL